MREFSLPNKKKKKKKSSPKKEHVYIIIDIIIKIRNRVIGRKKIKHSNSSKGLNMEIIDEI
jgi:hypothetical protein